MNLNVRYPAKGKYLWPALLLLWTTSTAWSQVKISGKVSDESGGVLPGVNVLVEGTTTGTSTNADGLYSIEVPGNNNVIVFSYVGYVMQKATIDNRKTIDIVLQADHKSLEEVVVVGYGSQAKRDITGAIGSISEKTITERQAVNVFDAMQGAVAGVQISSNSGAPGAGSNIIIRGASTFSDDGVQPLYIVDGMIVPDINGINPNDIKSIDILKDQASAAIYGSRSANGVVLITTKSGEEGKPRIDVRYLRSYNTIANTLPQVNKFERVLNNNTTRGTVLEKYNANADSVGLISSTSNDYQNLLTRTAVRNDLGLSISGGSNKIKFFTGLNYIGEEGVILTSYNNKANMRINVDYQASQKLKFGTRLSLGLMKTNNINEGNVLGWALKRITDYIVWYPDGSLAPIYAMGGQRNPVQEIYERKNITRRYEGNFNEFLEYQFNSWLQFRASATGNVLLSRNNQFVGKELDSNGSEDVRQSTGRDQTMWRWSVLSDAYFSANKSFGNHRLNAMVGGSIENGKTENLDFGAQRYVTESGLTTINLGTLNLSQTQTFAQDYAIVGAFTRWGYSFKDRYILNAILRADGSSKFGKNNRWGVFPSVSAAWRFSDENFMLWTAPVLSEGKIRVSYGTGGNDRALSYYEAQTRYESGHPYMGQAGVSAVGTYGNPNVRWEESRSTNFGLDLNFLSGRFNFTGEYYVKTTRDLIVPVNLPTQTGYSNMKMNLAGIENKGLELSVSGYPIPRTRNFSWQTTLNWARNRNKITNLARENYLQDNVWYVAAGMPAGNFYGYQQLGIYQYDASNAYSADYAVRLTPKVARDGQGNVIIGQNGQPTVEGYQLPNGDTYAGDVKQITVNGIVARGGDVIWENLPNAEGSYDNKIDDSDRQFLGNAQPRWDLGWNNMFTYKQWSLSFNMYARWGGKIYNKFMHSYASWGGNLHNQHPDYVRTGWKYPGQITDWYWIGNDRNYNYRELSSAFIEDASFIRLRNVRLSYQLASAWARKARMSNVMLYVYGNNLLTWTNYTGYDPEIGGGVLTPGRDAATYPRKREIGVGINIGL